MQQYNPRNLQPNQNQFWALIKDRLSPQGQESLAFKAVFQLFLIADGLYRNLASYTAPNLARFVDAGKYLTPTQEHDLVALTALAVAGMDTEQTYRIIQGDPTLSEGDRAVLLGALELFRSTAATSAAALGNPVWLEPS